MTSKVDEKKNQMIINEDQKERERKDTLDEPVSATLVSNFKLNII